GCALSIGPRCSWRWYYRRAYYGPPAVYYNPDPTVIYANPPVGVTPSAPDYYPAPNASTGNPPVELPPNNAAPGQSPGQQPMQGQPGDALAQAQSGQPFMYPKQ